MCAGDPVVEIGDAGDHRRPGLGRCVLVWAIVAARMKAQRAVFVQSRNAAIAQIRVHDSPCDRLRHGEQPPCRFARSRLHRYMCRFRRWLRVRPRQTQEAPRFVGNVAEVEEAAALADDVEQVAVLAGGGVGPFFRPAPWVTLSTGRTWIGPACCGRRRQASSGLRVGRWKGSDGTPPRRRARDGAPVRRRRVASRDLPLTDALEWIVL